VVEGSRFNAGNTVAFNINGCVHYQVTGLKESSESLSKFNMKESFLYVHSMDSAKGYDWKHNKMAHNSLNSGPLSQHLCSRKVLLSTT